MSYKLSDFIDLIENQNIHEIMTIFSSFLRSSSSSSLHDLHSWNKDWYFIMLENEKSVLREILSRDSQCIIDFDLSIQSIFQSCIFRGNEYADQEKKMNAAICDINVLLNDVNPINTFLALINENAMLPQGLKEYAAALYHCELQLAKQDKQDDLTHEELSAAVEVLQCVAEVNCTIDSNTAEPLLRALTLTEAYFENIQQNIANRYLKSLKKLKNDKRNLKNPLLTHSEIQNIIDESNEICVGENLKCISLEKINKCLLLNCGGSNNGHKALIEILLDPCLEFTKLNQDSSEIYFYCLQLEKKRKVKFGGSEDLLFEDVKNGINNASEILMKSTRLGLKLTAINLALDKQDAVEIYHYLTNKDLTIINVIRDCKEIYLQRMLEVRRFKISESGSQVGSGWIQCRLSDTPISFFYNVKDRFLMWSKPEDCVSVNLVKDSSLLNREELQAIIDMVNVEFKRELLFLSNETFIIRLQSVIRGFLIRDKQKKRWKHFQINERKIIIIQALWRMIRTRIMYLGKLNHYKTNVTKIVLVQSIWKMKIYRKRYINRIIFFRKHIKDIIKIQSFWKSSRIRNDYRELLIHANPRLKVIKRFLHLLENSYNDYQEEIEIQTLKQQISSSIRQNRLLEEEIKEMDLKIGLLVRNRISLQEVLTHHVKLKNFRSNICTNEGMTETNNETFLRGMVNKTTQQKIESYQHLFYLLQTNPNYLANLVFEMPHMQQNKFVETVIFSLYNYGSSNRDEYLLLRLFKKAVESEINTKIHNHPNDFLSANPFVIKLIVGLCRTAHAQASLKTILQPLIKSVIEDNNLVINTSPTEVYKQWVNEMEVSSGSPSGLPYDITPQCAMKHPEVKAIIDKSVLQLKQSCQKFIRALLKSPEGLPYSMRYMAKVIKERLHSRFPDSPEKDILKVVGNLIYYRYINSAIVAPDAFDMLERNVAEVLPPEKRRSLASIAKLLQFATANKGFGFESPHLAEVLNPFIRQCHEKFKEYFREVCRVEEPEKSFNMDQYSDLTSLTKPAIRMTLKEIRDTHNLLIQYEDAIAPNSNDPLHELLEDLGEVPVTDHNKDYVTTQSNKTTDIWLTLSPKHENHIVNPFDCNGATGDKKNQYLYRNGEHSKDNKKVYMTQTQNDLALDSLYIHTKRMIVDMLSCMELKGEEDGASFSRLITLIYLLNRSIKLVEDSQHYLLLQSRQQLERSLTPAKKKITHSRSYLMELNLSLEEKRRHIRSNLGRLEVAGIVSSENDYQDILNSIVRDIKTLKTYRCHRKQEINHLKDIFYQLGSKRQFQEDQMDYYERYCTSCLENMGKTGKHRRAYTQGTSGVQVNSSQLHNQPIHTIIKANNNRKTIKFSASELKKKGIILEIDDLSTNQYKNLQFEISRVPNSINPGQFDVTAKFMGVQMDKVCINISDLLQLQYEGTVVMRMFDRAKINVNLLVFLLNKKFFAK